MKHLNDYSVIVFLSAGEAEKWEYVHLLKGFPTFLDQKHRNRMPNVTFPKWNQKGLLFFFMMNRNVHFKKSEVINSMNYKKRKMEV